MSHYLQIILPLICELLCGTRGLSRLAAAAADTIGGWRPAPSHATPGPFPSPLAFERTHWDP